MTQDKLTDAITELDSDILERYVRMKNTLAEKKKPKQRAWVKWTSLAACFAILLIVGVTILPSLMGDDVTPGVTDDRYKGNNIQVGELGV